MTSNQLLALLVTLFVVLVLAPTLALWVGVLT